MRTGSPLDLTSVGSALDLRATWLAARALGTVSERAAARAVTRLWFTPWPVPTGDRASAREAAWLESTRPLRVPFAGGDLTGFDAGEGPIVLLVHGWGDRASRLGAFVAPLTASGFRAVGLDFPGHGDQPVRRTNMLEFADALRATADHLGDVHAVIAHSIGGATTAIALRDGLSVDRVALVASAVRLEHAVEKFGPLFRLPPRATAALRHEIERRFGATVWRDFAADLVAPTFDVPALLVHDRDDDQIAYADGASLAGAWPGAELVTTEGFGHHRLLRDPEVITRVVEFVRAPALRPV